MFAGCGCLYCAWCPMLNMLLPLQQSTQKLLSLTGQTCQVHDSELVCSFVSIIWKYARTKLCVLQFIVENVVRNTQRNVWLSGDINRLNAPVQFKKGIYKTHCVYRRGSCLRLRLDACRQHLSCSYRKQCVILTTAL
jgi:hypothetical protein